MVRVRVSLPLDPEELAVAVTLLRGLRVEGRAMACRCRRASPLVGTDGTGWGQGRAQERRV